MMQTCPNCGRHMPEPGQCPSCGSLFDEESAIPQRQHDAEALADEDPREITMYGLPPLSPDRHDALPKRDDEGWQSTTGMNEPERPVVMYGAPPLTYRVFSRPLVFWGLVGLLAIGVFFLVWSLC